tara:strand:- start:173 stop:274 length:102 start_codon:yes stop_codon:yes gene_type:complete
MPIAVQLNIVIEKKELNLKKAIFELLIPFITII